MDGPLTQAGKLALERGAKVATSDSVDSALGALRDGRGADAVLMDVRLDIKKLVDGLKSERIHVPVIACGIGVDIWQPPVSTFQSLFISWVLQSPVQLVF